MLVLHLLLPRSSCVFLSMSDVDCFSQLFYTIEKIPWVVLESMYYEKLSWESLAMDRRIDKTSGLEKKEALVLDYRRRAHSNTRGDINGSGVGWDGVEAELRKWVKGQTFLGFCLRICGYLGASHWGLPKRQSTGEKWQHSMCENLCHDLWTQGRGHNLLFAFFSCNA